MDTTQQENSPLTAKPMEAIVRNVLTEVLELQTKEPPVNIAGLAGSKANCRHCKIQFIRQRRQQRFCSLLCRIISDLTTAENPNACWEWKGFLDRDGYGHVTWNWIDSLVHRAMWKIRNGELSVGLSVLHKCDNARCANPNHLWIGTLTENNQDRDNKNRTRRDLKGRYAENNL